MACRAQWAKDHPRHHSEATKQRIATRWTPERRAAQIARLSSQPSRARVSVCKQCLREFHPVNRDQATCSRTCMGLLKRGGQPLKRQPATRAYRHKVIGMERPHGDGRWQVWTGERWDYRYRTAWNDAHPNDPLMPGEHIHHMNHDRSDDRPENLMKLSASAHAHEHSANQSAETRAKHRASALTRPRTPDGKLAPGPHARRKG